MKQITAITVLIAICCAPLAATAQGGAPVKFRSYDSGPSGLGTFVSGRKAASPEKGLTTHSTIEVSGNGLVELKRNNSFLQGNDSDAGKTVTKESKSYLIKQVRMQGGYVESYVLEEAGGAPALGSSPNDSLTATHTDPIATKPAEAATITSHPVEKTSENQLKESLLNSESASLEDARGGGTILTPDDSKQTDVGKQTVAVARSTQAADAHAAELPASSSTASTDLSVTGVSLIELKHANPFLQGTSNDLDKTVAFGGQNYSIKQLKSEGGFVTSYQLRKVSPSHDQTNQTNSSGSLESANTTHTASTAKTSLSDVAPSREVHTKTAEQPVPIALSTSPKSMDTPVSIATSQEKLPAATSPMTVSGLDMVELKRNNPLLAGTRDDSGKIVGYKGRTYAVKQVRFQDAFVECYLLDAPEDQVAHQSQSIHFANSSTTITKPTKIATSTLSSDAVGRTNTSTTSTTSTAPTHTATTAYSPPSKDLFRCTPATGTATEGASTLTISGPRTIELKRNNLHLTGTAQDAGKIVRLNSETYVVQKVVSSGASKTYVLASKNSQTPVATTPSTIPLTSYSAGASSYGGGGKTSIFDSVHGNGGYTPTDSGYTPTTSSITTQPVETIAQATPTTTVTPVVSTPVVSTPEPAPEPEAAKSLDRHVPPSGLARMGLGFLKAVAGNGTVGSIVSGLQQAATPPQPQVVVVPVAVPQGSMPAGMQMAPQVQFANPSPGSVQMVSQPRPVASNVVNTPVRDKWAVIVGISKFQDSSIPQLKYPAKDAKDFYDYLVTTGNFKPDHIRLLLNQDGTRERIMTEVGDFLPRVVHKDDLVVFYFSSHGSPASKDVGNKNFLIAHDTKKDKLFAGGIDVQFIMELMGSRIPANRLLIVLDACHSAGAVGAKDTENGANFNTENIRLGAGQLLLCSSAADERSWESKRYPNGVFTHYLIQGLNSKGARTKIGDAFNFLLKNVTDEVRQDENVGQTPRLKTDLWRGNDLILQVPPSQPEPLPEAVRKILEPDSKGKPY